MQQGGKLGRKARLALLVRKARVGSAQLQVGHQPVEEPVPALDHHKPAFLHLVRRDRQPHAQVFFQAPTHHITDRFIHVIHKLPYSLITSRKALKTAISVG